MAKTISHERENKFTTSLFAFSERERERDTHTHTHTQRETKRDKERKREKKIDSLRKKMKCATENERQKLD